MMYLLGVLLIAIGIAASIALHEVGHLAPAKLFKVRTTQYMVGFGPTLWSRTKGETEYGLKAIPLGGYVRMIGMFPPRPGDDGKLRRATSNPFHQMIEQAREDALDEVGPGDEDRVFYRLPVWKRLIIMSGGPLMNLVLAALLVTAVVTMHGFAEATSRVSSVAQCAATDVNSTDCTGLPESPALAAGLAEGDVIVSIDGTPVQRWHEVSYAIQNAGEQATFVIERDGQQQSLVADLVMRERQLVGPDGFGLIDADEEPIVGEVGFLGVSPTIVYVKQPITEVPPLVQDMFTRTARIVFTLPQRMVDVADAAFGTGERDQEGPISVVGVGRVAGEVADGGLPSAQSLSERMWVLVLVLAALNMALFVFNLIPLLPLDGGHIAGALWEGVKKTYARLRGLPPPRPVDTAKALPVAYAVAISLLAMGVLLIYADIVKPIRLT